MYTSPHSPLHRSPLPTTYPPCSSPSMDPRFESCFRDWLAQQESDLDDLLLALPDSSPIATPAPTTATDDHLRSLVACTMTHFEEYSLRRRSLLRDDPPAFFCPAWCSTFENSLLWLGGCRPTLAIRLVYSQSGSQLDAHLDEFLAASGTHGLVPGLVGLSPLQMDRIEALQRRTVREEERLTSRLATVQEDMADAPMLPVVMESGPGAVAATARNESMNGDGDRNARKVMGTMAEYGERLGRLIEEADGLRVRTVRELVVEILTPRQAVEMLAAGKKLHLAIHAWGLNRDRERQGEQPPHAQP